MKVTGIPETVPQTGPPGEKAALASVPEILAVVKLIGEEEMAMLLTVETSPLYASPVAVDKSSVQRLEMNSATLMSERPFVVIRGVRSLWGSQAILILAVVADPDETFQYSAVFVILIGEATDVAVELGVKNSAVKDTVLPAVDVRVKVCPLTLPFPMGNIKASPLIMYFVRGPLMNDDELPPTGVIAEEEEFMTVSALADEVVMIPFVRSS